MWGWLSGNAATIVICVLLLSAVAIAVIRMIKKKRSGGCDGCCARCGKRK